MPRLERLSPSERREMLVIRSDFAEKTAQFGSREPRIDNYGATNGWRAMGKQGKMY